MVSILIIDPTYLADDYHHMHEKVFKSAPIYTSTFVNSLHNCPSLVPIMAQSGSLEHY